LSHEINVYDSGELPEELVTSSYSNRLGSASSAGNEIILSELGIKKTLDHPVAAFDAVYINPSNNKIIVNTWSDPPSRVYEISENRELILTDIEIPNVTFDEGDKGKIFKWEWVNDDVVVGWAEICWDGRFNIRPHTYPK